MPGDGRGAEIGLGGAVTQMLTEADSQSNIQNEIGGAGLEEAGGSTADEDEGGVGERKEGNRTDRTDQTDQRDGPGVVTQAADDAAEENCDGDSDGAGLSGPQHPWWDSDGAARAARFATIPAHASAGGRGPRAAKTKDGGPTKKRPTERFWKRDRKQWRKIMAKVELECRKGETDEDLDDVPLKDMLDDVKRLLPNSVKVLRDHLGGS
jgi:hypothetical protein